MALAPDAHDPPGSSDSAPTKPRVPRVTLGEPAHVWADGRRVDARLVNLSSRGALIEVDHGFGIDDRLVMGVHLPPEIERLAGVDFLRLELRVVDEASTDGATRQYRCHHLADIGSLAHRRAAAVVIAAFEQQATAA